MLRKREHGFTFSSSDIIKLLRDESVISRLRSTNIYFFDSCSTKKSDSKGWKHMLEVL